MPVRVMPLQEPQVRPEPPLDGPEARLARARDSGPHGRGPLHVISSGGAPSWSGPAAITTIQPSFASA